MSRTDFRHAGAEADGCPTPSTVSISIDFVLAFLTGRFGASEYSDAARFDLVERFGAILRATLLEHGPIGSLHEFAARLSVRLVTIGALPSAFCSERGLPLGGSWWVSTVGGGIVAVSTVVGDDDEAESIHVDALGSAVGAKLLTMLGVPVERAVQNDLLEIRHNLILATMVPREEVESVLRFGREDDYDEELEQISRRLNVPTDLVFLRADRLHERMACGASVSTPASFEVATRYPSMAAGGAA